MATQRSKRLCSFNASQLVLPRGDGCSFRPCHETYSIKSEPPIADYYASLQVPQRATRHDIKKQFYRLSLLYHPDRQRAGQRHLDTAIKYHQITEAYFVLSDAQRRRAYDLARAAAAAPLQDSSRPPYERQSTGPSYASTSHYGSETFGRHSPHRPRVLYNVQTHFVGHYGRSASAKHREEAWRQYMHRGEKESKEAVIVLIKLASWLAVPILYTLVGLRG